MAWDVGSFQFTFGHSLDPIGIRIQLETGARTIRGGVPCKVD